MGLLLYHADMATARSNVTPNRRGARSREAVLDTAAEREHPNFLKLVIVMATQPPAGDAAHAHEVVTRVRDEALRRLRKQVAIAFGLEPRSNVVGRLARFSLALIDGAFIAKQAAPHIGHESSAKRHDAVRLSLCIVTDRPQRSRSPRVAG